MAFGAQTGTFTGAANSAGTSFAVGTLASGSGVVNVGDLVVVVFGEQTASTTTTVTDNVSASNVYAELQAASDAGTSTGHAYWCRIVVAGTITAITAVCNGGGNNILSSAAAGMLQR